MRTSSRVNENWNKAKHYNGLGASEQDADQDNSQYFFGLLEGEGKVYQTITVPSKGYYKLSCQGIHAGSDGHTAQLYATVGGTTVTVDLIDATDDYPTTTTGSNNYRNRIVFSNTIANKTGLKIGKELTAGNKTVSLLFYAESENTTVEIGVKKDNSTKPDYDSPRDYDTWTSSGGQYYEYSHDTDFAAFDDVQLHYLGEPLYILDERILPEDAKYLTAAERQTIPSNTNITTMLVRSFTLDKWNSIILPIDITAAQAKTAFGDDIEIAELTGFSLTQSSVIQFEKRALGADDIAITRGKLHLIRPHKVPSIESYQVGGTNYPGPFYLLGRRNIWKEGETETFTEKISNDEFTGGLTIGGTYTNLLGYKEGKEGVPAGSYVFSKGNLYHTQTDNLAVKGFRGWIEGDDNSSAKDLKFSIDGVIEEATSIADVEGFIPTLTDARVYSISGQYLGRKSEVFDTLPRGLYIVGNKKLVKN